MNQCNDRNGAPRKLKGVIISKIPSRFALYVFLSAVLQPSSAFAYIDPNAAGLLFQLLAPIFAGILGAWVFMRKAIAGLFRGLWRKLIGKADQ
jgi:hypothetical protein